MGRLGAAQDPGNLVQHADGIAPMVQRQRADHEVQGASREWDLRRVPLFENDAVLQAGALGGSPGLGQHLLGEVDTGHLQVGRGLRQPDRQVPGAATQIGCLPGLYHVHCAPGHVPAQEFHLGHARDLVEGLSDLRIIQALVADDALPRAQAVDPPGREQASGGQAAKESEPLFGTLHCARLLSMGAFGPRHDGPGYYTTDTPIGQARGIENPGAWPGKASC